jgi:NAD(P)-dependent dehydrogenase (short-subunit alcohol dehydrogenase family)
VEIWDSAIVVAGAATGIGPALCADLAHKGARLGLVDLDRHAGVLLTRQLSGLTLCTFRHSDLSVPAEAIAAIRSLAAALEGIDAFVMVHPQGGSSWRTAAAEAVRHRRFPHKPVGVVSMSARPTSEKW